MTYKKTTSEALDNIVKQLETPGQHKNSKRPSPGPAGPSIQPETPIQLPEIENNKKEATRIYYSQRVCLINPQRLSELESSIPNVVGFLSSLSSQPEAVKSFSSLVAAGRSANADPKENDKTAQRLVAIMGNLALETFKTEDPDERVFPIIPIAALGLAAIMAGYTVVHQWQR